MIDVVSNRVNSAVELNQAIPTTCLMIGRLPDLREVRDSSTVVARWCHCVLFSGRPSRTVHGALTVDSLVLVHWGQIRTTLRAVSN